MSGLKAHNRIKHLLEIAGAFLLYNSFSFARFCQKAIPFQST